MSSTFDRDGLAPPISGRTARRNRYRDPSHIDALELARNLAYLAQRHPQFAEPLHKLMVRIRLHSRASSQSLQLRITELLQAAPLTFAELAEETLLGPDRLREELAQLEQQGILEVCDSRGRRAHERHEGGLWTRYYRLRQVNKRAA